MIFTRCFQSNLRSGRQGNGEGAVNCTPNSVGLQVLGVGPVFRRPLRIRSLIFFSFGVRCSGVPKTPKNQILDFLYSLSWCSDVAFLIVGYRSGAPLVFQRPLNFPFQIFFSGSVRCSGVLKTPKFQISDFRLFIILTWTASLY